MHLLRAVWHLNRFHFLLCMSFTLSLSQWSVLCFFFFFVFFLLALLSPYMPIVRRFVLKRYISSYNWNTTKHWTEYIIHVTHTQGNKQLRMSGRKKSDTNCELPTKNEKKIVSFPRKWLSIFSLCPFGECANVSCECVRVRVYVQQDWND